MTTFSDAHEIVTQILDRSWDLATEQNSNMVSSLASLDGTLVSAGLSMTPATLDTDVSVTDPGVTIPATAEGPDSAFYQSLVNDAISSLSTLFSGFMTEYFPVDGTTNAAVEGWLQSAIAGGTGVNAAVENQIWERDRTRISDDSTRAQDEVVATFAAKRFPLPPGAAAHAVLMIQQKAQDELAKSSREVAIKSFETEVAGVRFAVEKAIQLRQVALSTAGEYIRGLAMSLTVGQQMAIAKSEAQPRLIAAAADYYRARQGAKELLLKKDSTASAFTQEARKEELHADISVLDNRVKAAMAGAQAIAHQAAAALNNLHASVGYGAQAHSSGTTQVSYSYSNDTNATVAPLTSAG